MLSEPLEFMTWLYFSLNSSHSFIFVSLLLAAKFFVYEIFNVIVSFLGPQGLSQSMENKPKIVYRFDISPVCYCFYPFILVATHVSHIGP
jgi:hypothetical protein